METVTINDTDYDGYYYESESDSYLPMSDLRQEWNRMRSIGRDTFYTTKMKIAKITADEALWAIYYEIEKNGIEDMAWYLFEQQLLDEIPSFGRVEYYVKDKHIDPDVDLEDD